MVCENCGLNNCGVYDKRDRAGTGRRSKLSVAVRQWTSVPIEYTWRRMKCFSCGHRFTTIELRREDLIKVLTSGSERLND